MRITFFLCHFPSFFYAGPGFNCIAGENGAGKSNLLDVRYFFASIAYCSLFPVYALRIVTHMLQAVSFALGEAPSNLRAKTAQDLLGRPGCKLEVILSFEVYLFLLLFQFGF